MKHLIITLSQEHQSREAEIALLMAEYGVCSASGPCDLDAMGFHNPGGSDGSIPAENEI